MVSRLVRAFLAFWLAAYPGLAAAQQAVRTAPAAPAGVPASPAPVGVSPAALTLPAPVLTLPAVSPAAPTAVPIAAPASALPTAAAPLASAARTPGGLAAARRGARPGALAAARPVQRRTALAGRAIAAEIAASAKAPADASRVSAETQFQLLLGARPASASGEVAVPVPSNRGARLRLRRPASSFSVRARGARLRLRRPASSFSVRARGALASLLAPRPARLGAGRAAEASRPAEPSAPSESARSVRWMQTGTAFWKFGMDPVTIAIPLLALSALGGAVHVALLVVLYRSAQIVAASFAAGLTDRKPASRILVGGVLVQAGLVAALLALSAGGALAPAVLFPAYAAIGAATGVIETARRVVPALVLGQDKGGLERYNGRLHIFYEVAGVAGALVAGALIMSSGPMAALWLQPGAALMAAWAWWRVKHPFTAAEPPSERSPLRRAAAAARSYIDDVRFGARTIFGDPRFRLVALVMVLPTVVHRVFEDVVLPLFAKKVLELPAASAWLLGASNAGELLGAVMLLKLAHAQGGSSFRWLKLSAIGLLGAWILSATTALPVIVPIILAFSLTWAASDLSLLSLMQSELPEKAQPRVLGFLVGLTTLIAMLASLGLAKWLDFAGPSLGFVGANVAFTFLAVAVFLAARRLARK